MTITALDQSVAVLRALLTEDMDTFRRLHGGLNPDERPVFAVVLGAALTEAAARRFGSHRSTADIVMFVAEARASQVGQATTAEQAEQAIRISLGEEDLPEDLDVRALGSAQTAMLFALVNETEDSRASLDSLLTASASQAEAWLNRRASR